MRFRTAASHGPARKEIRTGVPEQKSSGSHVTLIKEGSFPFSLFLNRTSSLSLTPEAYNTPHRRLNATRSSEGRADEKYLENFACKASGLLDSPWYAQVIDPYTVGRYNPIWWRTGGTAESSGVCRIY
jgi:hypothetical protein